MPYYYVGGYSSEKLEKEESKEDSRSGLRNIGVRVAIMNLLH